MTRVPARPGAGSLGADSRTQTGRACDSLGNGNDDVDGKGNGQSGNANGEGNVGAREPTPRATVGSDPSNVR